MATVPVSPQAVDSLPETLKAQIDNSNVVQGAPSTGANNRASIASVDADSPDTIKVNRLIFSVSLTSKFWKFALDAVDWLDQNPPPLYVVPNWLRAELDV